MLYGLQKRPSNVPGGNKRASCLCTLAPRVGSSGWHFCFCKVTPELHWTGFSVLRILLEPGSTLTLKRCKFFAKSTKYLGYVVCATFLELAESILYSVATLEYPRAQSELHFLWDFATSPVGLYRNPLVSPIRSVRNWEIFNKNPFGPQPENESVAAALLIEDLVSLPITCSTKNERPVHARFLCLW